MRDMRFFGHRGAAGLALENSRASVLASLDHDLEVIEFDMHRTKDGKLVIIHDHTTRRVAAKRVSVHELTLAELKQIPLKNGQPLLDIDELFTIIGDQKPIMADIKDSNCGQALCDALDRHPEVTVHVTSFEHDNIRTIRALRPEIKTYVLEHFSPFEIISSARGLRATGVSLNMWLMNPLTYHLARRHGLELLAYTINQPWLMRFFKKLYPGITLYTDHPERIPPDLKQS